jgi:hypothetical protein
VSGEGTTTEGVERHAGDADNNDSCLSMQMRRGVKRTTVVWSYLKGKGIGIGWVGGGGESFCHYCRFRFGTKIEGGDVENRGVFFYNPPLRTIFLGVVFCVRP